MLYISSIETNITLVLVNGGAKKDNLCSCYNIKMYVAVCAVPTEVVCTHNVNMCHSDTHDSHCTYNTRFAMCWGWKRHIVVFLECKDVVP